MKYEYIEFGDWSGMGVLTCEDCHRQVVLDRQYGVSEDTPCPFCAADKAHGAILDALEALRDPDRDIFDAHDRAIRALKEVDIP